MKDYITNKILSVFLIIQILLVSFFSRKPEWVERYYSNGLYPIISSFLRKLLGWIPISVGDILYLILLFIFLRWVWFLIRTRMAPFRQHLYAFGAFLSIVFFAFHILWGLNYYRIPFYQVLEIKNLEYIPKELVFTTKKHVNLLNDIHQLLVLNNTTAIDIPYKRREVYKMSSNEFKHLQIDSIELSFRGKSIKNSLLSKPLCYMGFSGYLNPFTGESQVNKKIPKTLFPVTTCHEMAHQLGYASEDEANYIGYLACINSEDQYFQYSGELMAVQYLLYNLSQYDKGLYKKFFAMLHIGIQKDIQKNHDFWDSYHNPLEPYFKRFYDVFLKANRQKEGIQSYNGMVGYLVNYKEKN